MRTNQSWRIGCRWVMVLACLVVLEFGGSSIHAQSQAESGNCGLISVGSKGEIDFPLMVVSGQASWSSSPGGETRVECHGKMSQSPYRQITLDYAGTEEMMGTGIPCVTPWGESTQDWKQVVTTSGEATLICHLNGHSKP